jgi:hypothetical protein
MTKAYKALPAAEELWELFDYKPLTGELVWKVRLSNRTKAGATTGSAHTKGYKTTRINTRSYLVHRVIWAWIHGRDPENFQVDHIDGDRRNNTPGNLRLATNQQNALNSKTRAHNVSGVKGAKLTPHGKYQARIRLHGTTHYLGTYDTAEEAGAAYKAAATRLHGEFAKV